jgi:hypothetical protein
VNIIEPARSIPVARDYDVVVVGGGVAGVAAALAAVRNGARVCLVEKLASLGGLATIGNVTVYLPLCDGNGRQVIGGLSEELLHLSVADLGKEDRSLGFVHAPDAWKDPDGSVEARAKNRFETCFNPASFALSMEDLAVRSGVDIWYDTRFSDAAVADGRITHVIVENVSGRLALSTRAVIDATGDAAVSFAAGEETDFCDSNALAAWWFYLVDARAHLCVTAKPYSERCVREEGKGPFFRGDVGKEVTEHILQSRAAVREQLAKLRKAEPGKDVYPIRLPEMASFRTTRRLVAPVTLHWEDDHRWFDDCIAMTGDWRAPGPIFAIPLGAIRGARTVNLLAAGRCISADGEAWEVTRTIPACAATGHAAGTAAAMAASDTGGDLSKIDLTALKDRLLSENAIIDPSATHDK